jgi:hypothetical protein
VAASFAIIGVAAASEDDRKGICADFFDDEVGLSTGLLALWPVSPGAELFPDAPLTGATEGFPV